MDFELSEDQAMIRRAVAELAAKFDDQYWLEKDAAHEFPAEFYQAFAEGGWLGITIPEEYGGHGFGIAEAALLLEEVSASGAGMNGASSMHLSIFGMHPVIVHGSEEMKRENLPRIVHGDLHVCFGVTEPGAGLDTTRITTFARRDGSDYLVNGRKVWISKAMESEKVLLLTRTTRFEDVAKKTDGLTLFLTAWNTGWALQAHEYMAVPSLAALAFNALQIPALLLLVHSPADLVTYAALVLPFTLAAVGFNAWYLARKGVGRWWRVRPALAGARGIVREAWPLALTQASALVMLNSGTLILGFTNSDEAVGQFASAFRLILVPGVITAALWNAYFPAFARSHDCPAEASALSREYVGLLAWIGLPIAALGWALGRHIVQLLYGPAFAPSGRYFEWLCLTVGLTFLNYGIVATLVPWGRSGLQLKITASAAALNLIVNASLVPFYGPWSAVAATVAAEFLIVVLGLTIRQRLRLFWHPILPVVGPPLVCSAMVAAGLTALPASFDRLWWAELLAGAAVLGACLIVFEGRTLVRVWKMMRGTARCPHAGV